MSGLGAMMLDLWIDWEAREDVSDGQGGYMRTYATAVPLRAAFAPTMPSATTLASQLDSRARATILIESEAYGVHEGDHVTTPDGRAWDVRNIAPYTSVGMPVATADVMLLTCIEVEGN